MAVMVHTERSTYNYENAQHFVMGDEGQLIVRTAAASGAAVALFAPGAWQSASYYEPTSGETGNG